VQNWALRDGATTLTLWVTRGNHAATRLYRRAGFSKVRWHSPRATAAAGSRGRGRVKRSDGRARIGGR
jgi:ribosomal protein S18 acetylase RimI-like enzyme